MNCIEISYFFKYKYDLLKYIRHFEAHSLHEIVMLMKRI